MKNWVIVILMLPLVWMSSCCKRNNEALTEMSVTYKTINDPVIVYDLRYKEGGFDVIIDTTQKELRANNNYTIFIDFEAAENHILIMADSSHTDTLSSFSINRDKCDEIENFGYYHNSIYKTDIRLEIE
jgi:hypothetical protein